MFIWIAIVAIFVSFLVCWGIGGNDLANSFGTAYGSKVLTLKQIILIAAFCEFGGAILLGGEVSKTIASNITEFSAFKGSPGSYMYGMFSALIASAFWLFLATYKKLPVSTTHSIVGGVLGFALVFGGGSSVKWSETKDVFPFIKGVVPIFISWFTSPILSMLVSMLTFATLRKFVLRERGGNAAMRAAISFSLIVFFTIFVNAFFVFSKGMKKKVKWETTQSLWVSLCIGTFFGILTGALSPKLIQRANAAVAKDELEQQEKEDAAEAERENEMEDKQAQKNTLVDHENEEPLELHVKPSEALPHGEAHPHGPHLTGADGLHLRFSDVTGSHAGSRSHTPTSKDVTEPDATAAVAVIDPEEKNKRPDVELFSPTAEWIFKYLQIFSSMVISFAHGANDVSNSIGALAAVWSVYESDKVEKEAPVEIWMLALGGAGIVLGLATMGRKIIVVLGEEMVTLTPSRGFSAQFATSLVVSCSSALGLPISTTHCVTGAVIGIGLIENAKGSVEWAVVGRTMIGWVITLLVTGSISAIVFAQGMNAPCAD